ncbi:MAG: LytTR family DNA-binding domain-containing protein [Bacteroidales bacterium]|nr:LytTR family DNA-binding domain-containing protein [Bacteroidales bacterium]
MKRILIIEDERMSASRLKRLISDIDDTLDVIGPLTTVEEVIETIKRDTAFDLIISDIRLHDRLVFEAFHEVMPRCMVIFTTAYDEYALEAFRHNGIDYLLKPIEQDALANAINKLKATNQVSPPWEGLGEVARLLRCFRERILVTRGDELIPLRTDSVRYFCIEDNIVTAYTNQGDSYRIPLTMNDLEQQLNPDLFFRLNRQYIAHIDSIRKISFFFSSKLIVRLTGCDDDHIVISKEKSALFKQWLDR